MFITLSNVIKHESTREKLKLSQETQRYCYDQGTHELYNLKTRDSVMLQSTNGLSWKPATVAGVKMFEKS